jgi:hypothetical protein
MTKEDDEQFVRVELPNRLRALYARAITKPSLASKLVFGWSASLIRYQV